MQEWDLLEGYAALLTPEVVSLLGQIHECKGEQTVFFAEHPDALASLREIAKIESAEASSQWAGFDVPEERLKKLAHDKTTPRTRSEQEIAGYRDVLVNIHENYAYLPLKPSLILQLHRELYQYCSYGDGGSYRTEDVLRPDAPLLSSPSPDVPSLAVPQPAAPLPDTPPPDAPSPAAPPSGVPQPGAQQPGSPLHDASQLGTEEKISASALPVPAREISEAIERLCCAYEEALQQTNCDPLLCIPVFVLEFLHIRPFRDANGRMSRLLTLLLLHRQGVLVGKYVSLERRMLQTRQAYEEALRESLHNEPGAQSDPLPFVRYMLGIVANAYRELSFQIKLLAASGAGKMDRIREALKSSPGAITKAELMRLCPDISIATVQRSLIELQKSGAIVKIGGGRYTSYAWDQGNGERRG